MIKSSIILKACISATLLLGSVGSVCGDVFAMPAGQNSLVFSVIGDLGNAPDTRYGGSFGAVGYTYRIGSLDVTTAQYCQFLNAVAKDDPYGLYNAAMSVDPLFHTAACGIVQSGSTGSYTYSIDTTSASGLDHANYPVNNVSWGDAARFVNWLHNGQPTGAEGVGTTERGAYTLDGAITAPALAGVTRSAGAKYWIPTENEWYKAAYYKGGGTSAGYWDYATRSDIVPGNSLGPSLNNANHFVGAYTVPVDFLTPVGVFGASYSAYGTADQTGNVMQWNETDVTAATRGLRGGSWASDDLELKASTRLSSDPTYEYFAIGFRIATAVPEPSSAGLVLLGVVGIFLRRRGKN